MMTCRHKVDPSGVRCGRCGVSWKPFVITDWIAQQCAAMDKTAEMLIVACLCCAIARWLHGTECWVEV